MLFVCLFIVSIFGCGALPVEGQWKLDIIHYNDFHSRFEETSVSSPLCTTNDSHCLGGFPRLYATIKSLMREKPDALLLNAGDSFQGTLWYTLLKWNVTQEFMNMLPHDAHAVGNHEFDDGPAGLVPYLTRLKAPCLAANMDATHEPSLRGVCKNSTVVVRNGRKIGIIGVITVSTALYASPGGAVFTDERIAAQREAAKLAAEGVDVIVLLSHAGLDVDREIAANYSENIDVIIGGHTHSLMWNGPAAAPSGEPVDDTYPVIVQPDPQNDHKVMIVQASCFTKYMGNLTIYFDSNGNYQSWEGGPIFLNRSYPEDPEIKAMLQPLADVVHEAAAVVLARTEVDLDVDQCKYGECVLGDLICDGMLRHAKANYPSNLTTVAITSQSNLYGSFKKGPMTFGELFNAFPYHDRILMFKIKAKYVMEAFEIAFSEDTKDGVYVATKAFQVAGMRATLNVTKPAGHRLVSMEVKNGPGYRKLEKEEFIRVVAPDFLVRASGYTMFDNRSNTQKIGHDSDIFEKHIKMLKTVHPATEDRIIVQY